MKKKSVFRGLISSILLSSIVMSSMGTSNACEAHGISMVDAGNSYSLALKQDGTVWAWGLNMFGQLGDGTTTDSSVPVQVKNIDNVVKIDATISLFSLALKKDGTVWAWGSNAMGQSSSTKESIIKTPNQISNLSNIVDIDGGSEYGLALSAEGSVWSWGSNTSGSLGQGTTVPGSKTAGQVVNLDNVKAIAAGSSTAYAVKQDGTVWAWGDNQYGQMGTGRNLRASNVPMQVPGLTDVVKISAGDGYALALKSDGTVWAWGDNGFGELGNGTKSSQYVPVKVDISDVVDIEGGRHKSFVRKSDGTVWAWGTGMLGNGTDKENLLPIQIDNLKGYIQVSAGGHALGVKSDFTAWGWGGNVNGQLGNGTTNYSKVPVAVIGLQ